jgi:hypothetical protein
MKHAAFTHLLPASPKAGNCWLVRLLRVMVVLLLIFDQVSSPLHNHHHDAGPDGVMQQIFLSDGQAFSSHADQPTVSHAVTGIKREARYSSVLPDADELPADIFATFFASFGGAIDVLPRSWPAETKYAIVSYRSLPPCCRAPPRLT